MKAIILAGGFGTRLRPLSCTRPKLLFPVLNRPLLDGTFQRLNQAGIDGVVLAVKYMSERFVQRYGDSNNGLSVSYSHEKIPMGTGGAIKYAEDLIGHDEPFLVLNGDVFTTFDYKKIVQKHKENKAVATIGLYQVEDPSRYGTVKLTKDNKITQFVEKAPKEKAPSNLINAGVYVLEPEIFDYIPAGKPVSIEHEVFPLLAQEGKLFGYEFNDIWIDIGKPEDYLQANKILLQKEQEHQSVENYTNISDGAKILEPVKIDSGVIVEQDSQIGPYAIIGKDVVLGRNVTVKDSVVFANSTIMDNAYIEGSIIGEDVTVGKGAKVLNGCVIGDNASIKDGVIVSRNVTVCHSKSVTENVGEGERVI